MSKYSAFGDYLKRQPHDLVPVSFAEIEKITRTKLPPSAHKHRPWWSNNPNNSVLTRVWLDAGFKSEQVDMPARKLVFRRVRDPNQAGKTPLSPPNEKPFHPAYGFMQGLVRIMPGTDLTKPADPEWAARIEAEYGLEHREE